jgi:peptide-methionine (S)-S-oxide reductase
VEIDYDPAQVTYEQLLGIFWESHDPTTLNRQGPDIGTQYREKSGVFKRPIATEIAPASEFFRAEEYHQQYFEKRGMKSCHLP